MYTKTTRLILGLVLAAAMLLPVSASAAGNIRIGKITVLPEVAYTGEWNDNIFLDSENEKSDYINKVTLGLGLMREVDEDNYARLGYTLDVFKYSDYSDNDYENNEIYAGFGYKAPGGLYTKLDERFVSTEDPYGSDNDYLEGERVKRWNNTVKAALGYEFGNKFRIEASYRNFIEDYHEFADKWQSKLDHEPGLTAFYRIMPKTSALVEYRVQMREYTEQQNSGDNSKGADSDTAQDFVYHKAFVGLHWDASAKINGDLKLGIGYKDYENDENWDNVDYEDTTTWIAETRLYYQLFQRTQLNGKLLRQVKDSSAIGSTRYTDTVFGLGAKQQFSEKLTGMVDLAYTFDEYDGDDDREDDVYAAKIGLDYDIQDWLTAGVNYTYKQRESNIDDKDYTNNRFAFTIGAAF
jgi:hypothetical protein